MPPLLRWIGTAAQPGPVLYRDPLGVISPDGVWLAYTEGLHVRARRVEGGPVRELGPAERFVAHLAWLPDSRRVVSFGRDPVRGETGWWVHDVGEGSARSFWADQPHAARVRQLAFCAEGTALGVAARGEGSELWRLDSGGRLLGSTPCRERWSEPALSADGRASAGLARIDGRPRLALPCGAAPAGDAPQAYGPLAFSPAADVLYCAMPGARGTLDLYARSRGGRAVQLTHFSRDSWAPSAARDGRVLFKLQDYSAFVARVDADGGEAQALATFQSETPTWHPSQRQIAVTYGSWRRAADDFHYPDIAQSLGVISLDGPVPAAAPTWTAYASASEDQGMVWSPDGRFIALHTHFGPSDDIWLMPADRSREPEPLSSGGSETGWPRWSPDGRWIAYTTEIRAGAAAPAVADLSERPPARRAIMRIGIDPQTGKITHPQSALAIEDCGGRPVHAEWAADGAGLFFESADGAALRSLRAVAASGGRARVVHEFESEQGLSGISASPDGRWLAYVAPAADGYYQIFRVPVRGGPGEQLTFDPSHKTQPCYAPDGRALALTVWSYRASFWLLDPR